MAHRGIRRGARFRIAVSGSLRHRWKLGQHGLDAEERFGLVVQFVTTRWFVERVVGASAQNRHDIDRMLSLVADQVEFRIGLSNPTLAGATKNRDQLRTQFSRLAENLPNARTEVLELISDGSVVMTKERTTGLPGGGRYWPGDIPSARWKDRDSLGRELEFGVVISRG